MLRAVRYFLLTLILGISVSPDALAQQRTIFDAFKSIFQSSPSPNVIPVTPERPRRVRKPAAPLAPRRVIRAPRSVPAEIPDIIPSAAPVNAMPWPNAAPPAPGPKVATPIIAEDVAPPKPTYFVQVLGDSIALLLAQGLTEALADRPEISVIKRAKESSGLVRDDYFSWPKASRELLSGTEQTDVVLIMVGSNDHQPFYAKDGKILADLGSEDWLKTYRARVEEEVGIFKEKHAKFIWIGMPIMRSSKFSADMLQLNEVYRDVVTASGETYIDIWAAFADEKAEFDSSGPDVNGQPARLRTSDGIHFTKAGQRKLASFVEKEIRRAYDGKKANETPLAVIAPTPPLGPDGLPADGIPIVVNPETKLQQDKLLADKPRDESQIQTLVPAAEPARIIRPVSGVVVSLTTPPVSASGELIFGIATRKALTKLDDQDPQEAHIGRTDDFNWPPN